MQLFYFCNFLCKITVYRFKNKNNSFICKYYDGGRYVQVYVYIYLYIINDGMQQTNMVVEIFCIKINMQIKNIKQNNNKWQTKNGLIAAFRFYT